MKFTDQRPYTAIGFFSLTKEKNAKLFDERVLLMKLFDERVFWSELYSKAVLYILSGLWFTGIY